MQTGLYANKAYLTLEDIQRLTQSSVFLTECIYLPSSVRAAPTLGEEERTFIHTRLRELHEIGAFKFWEIEGQTEFLTGSTSSAGIDLPIEKIIPRDEYLTIYNLVIDRLNSSRREFLGVEDAGSFDGITEIVLGKHVIWTFALNSYLDTRNIILDPATEANNLRFFRKLLAKTQIAEEVIQEISVSLHIPDLSLLNISQIESCRSYMPAFREKLLSNIDTTESSYFVGRPVLIKQISGAIVDDFLEYLQEQAQKPKLFKTPKELFWNLAQLVLSRIITEKNKDRFFKWNDDKQTNAPELLLLKLRDIKKELANRTLQN